MNLYHVTNMSAVTFIILALAIFRLTRVIVVDEIFSDIRNKLWDRFPPETSYLGFFFTCEWCVSMWVALPTVVFYAINPSITLLVGCIFALSAVSSLITARLDQ
jgi:hypothetical protein